jgi:response regulator RpfG family c-di-GMP phosphodiesterase
MNPHTLPENREIQREGSNPAVSPIIHREQTLTDAEDSLYQSERILVVDDEAIIRETVAEYLKAHGFDCLSAASGEQALQHLREDEFALLIADIRMPGYTGLQLLNYVGENCRHVSVIMITAVADLQTAVDSMKLGAFDYITKPFDLDMVVESVEKALHQRSQLIRDDQIARNLQRALKSKTFALNSALKDLQLHRDTTLDALVRALDAREHETGCHSARVQGYAVALAQQLGFEGDRLANLARGALLHDIGKIGVSDQILLKPGKLDKDEWIQIKQHPLIGYEIVKGVSFLGGASALIISHHERFDGTGYPSGLKGEDVPLEARLFAIIDTYDAMTSDRPYRKALTPEIAKEEIIRCSGSQFDPRIVDLFLEIPQPILDEISKEHG